MINNPDLTFVNFSLVIFPYVFDFCEKHIWSVCLQSSLHYALFDLHAIETRKKFQKILWKS